MIRWDNDMKEHARESGLALVKVVIQGKEVPRAHSLAGCSMEHAAAMNPQRATRLIHVLNETEAEESTANEWDRFFRGEWKEDMPEVPGVYPVLSRLDRDKPYPPTKTRVVYVDEGRGILACSAEWGGYWWSEPFPNLPPPATLEEDRKKKKGARR